MSDRLERAINFLRMQGVEVIRLPSEPVEVLPNNLINLAQQRGIRP